MIKKRKVYIKGEKYKCRVTVICTKTTCNYSSDVFEGVDIATGHYSTTWNADNFDKYTEE